MEFSTRNILCRSTSSTHWYLIKKPRLTFIGNDSWRVVQRIYFKGVRVTYIEVMMWHTSESPCNVSNCQVHEGSHYTTVTAYVTLPMWVLRSWDGVEFWFEGIEFPVMAEAEVSILISILLTILLKSSCYSTLYCINNRPLCILHGPIWYTIPPSHRSQ